MEVAKQPTEEVYLAPALKNCSKCKAQVDSNTGYCMKANRYVDYGSKDTECELFDRWLPTCSG